VFKKTYAVLEIEVLAHEVIIAVSEFKNPVIMKNTQHQVDQQKFETALKVI